jgi:hypothetical protein
MRPRGEGRHCERCEKTVVDLSRVTRSQAEAMVRAHGGQLCARLAEDETGKTVFRPERTRLPVFAPIALAGLLAACAPEASEEVAPSDDTEEVLDPGDGAHLDASAVGFGGSLATGVMMPIAPSHAPVPVPVAVAVSTLGPGTDGTPTDEQLALTRRKQRRRQQPPPQTTGQGVHHMMGVMACDLDP